LRVRQFKRLGQIAAHGPSVGLRRRAVKRINRAAPRRSRTNAFGFAVKAPSLDAIPSEARLDTSKPKPDCPPASPPTRFRPTGQPHSIPQTPFRLAGTPSSAPQTPSRQTKVPSSDPKTPSCQTEVASTGL
jgi:hypothetical protein